MDHAPADVRPYLPVSPSILFFWLLLCRKSSVLIRFFMYSLQWITFVKDALIVYIPSLNFQPLKLRKPTKMPVLYSKPM